MASRWSRRLAKDCIPVCDADPVLKRVLRLAKDVTTWAGGDSVAGFRAQLLRMDVALQLAEATGNVATVPGDVRQAHWSNVFAGKDGRAGLLGNERAFKLMVQTAEFTDWVNGLPSDSKKSRVVKMIRHVESAEWSAEWWRQIAVLSVLLSPIQRAIALVSDTNTPTSALLPLARALKEDLGVALNSSDFIDAFGDEVANGMLQRLDVRLNLDGKTPVFQRDGQRGPQPARRATQPTATGDCGSVRALGVRHRPHGI